MPTQRLDFIYSQSCILYDIISHAPRPLTDPKNPNPGPHVNGVVGYVSHASVDQLADQMGHMSISLHLSNSMQSTQLKNPQHPGGKKKRNKKKHSNTEQGTAPTQKKSREGRKEKKKI